MEIRNNSNMSFQARMPKELKTKILDTALEYGPKAVKNAKRQIQNVQSWGSSDSILDLQYALKKGDKLSINFEPDTFALSKENLPVGVVSTLPKRKNSVFGTFMALRENDFLSAEKELVSLTPKAENTPLIDLLA